MSRNGEILEEISPRQKRVEPEIAEGRDTTEISHKGRVFVVPIYDDGRLDCPFCGQNRVFAEHGLRSHFGHHHNIPPFKRECDYCGELFLYSVDHSEKRFCSGSCSAKHIGEQREIEKDDLVCDYPSCDETFERTPAHIGERNYCSFSHASKDRWRREKDDV